MDENDRVVVHIHDPGVRRDRLGNLVRIVRRRNACPDVEELPDAGLACQVPNRPGEEGPVRLDPETQSGSGREYALGCLPVSSEVVLAAQPVVVHPSRMSDRRVDPVYRAELIGCEPVIRLILSQGLLLSFPG